MALNDIWSVTVLGTIHTVNWANTMLLKQVSVDGVGDPWEEAVDTQIDFLWTSLSALLSDDIEVTGARVRRVSPTPGPGYFFSRSLVGQVATPSVPSGAAAVIALQTDLVSRKGRGRIKLAGLPLANVVDGRMDAATWASFSGFLTNLLGDMSIGGGEATFRAGLLPSGGSFEGFTGFQVRARMKTQRSRQLA